MFHLDAFRERRSHGSACEHRWCQCQNGHRGLHQPNLPELTCGYVSSDNCSGDTFHCRNPYWDRNSPGDANHVAATNLKSRITDRQISVFAHYSEVKMILDERFCRRKEGRVGARIVPLGTTGNGVLGACVDNGANAHGRTPSKPRRSPARRGRW